MKELLHGKSVVVDRTYVCGSIAEDRKAYVPQYDGGHLLCMLSGGEGGPENEYAVDACEMARSMGGLLFFSLE